MKLRIKDNSVRLRLDRTEVARLAETGSVERTTTFGDASARCFKYSISTVAGLDAGRAQFGPNGLNIQVPAEWASSWEASDRVGGEWFQATAERPLHILVEKDFACLTSRESDEDQACFEHPGADAAS